MFHKSNGRQNFDPLTEADGGKALALELHQTSAWLSPSVAPEAKLCQPALPDAQVVIAMLRREKVRRVFAFMSVEMNFCFFVVFRCT